MPKWQLNQLHGPRRYLLGLLRHPTYRSPSNLGRRTLTSWQQLLRHPMTCTESAGEIIISSIQRTDIMQSRSVLYKNPQGPHTWKCAGQGLHGFFQCASVRKTREIDANVPNMFGKAVWPKVRAQRLCTPLRNPIYRRSESRKHGHHVCPYTDTVGAA